MESDYECPECGTAVVEDALECPECGEEFIDDSDIVQDGASESFNEETMDVPTRNAMTRFIANILEILGFIVLIVGLVIALFGAAGALIGEPEGLLVGGGIVLFGAMSILIAEGMMVLVDIEHNTRRTAEIQAYHVSNLDG